MGKRERGWRARPRHPSPFFSYRPPQNLVGHVGKPQRLQVPRRAHIVLNGGRGGGVEGERERKLARNDGRKNADPHREKGHHRVKRGRHRPHKVTPHAGAVHEAVEEREAALEQGVVARVEDDLKVALGPPGPLLKAVAHLVGGFAHGEVLLDVARKQEGGREGVGVGAASRKRPASLPLSSFSHRQCHLFFLSSMPSAKSSVKVYSGVHPAS